MKRFSFVIIIVFLKTVTGYAQDNYSIYTDKDRETVINALVVEFFKSGIGIDRVDRDNGLIISTSQNFFRSWKYYDDKKKQDTVHAILLKRKFGLQPLTITGRLQAIVIRENGKTLVSVKVVDVEAMSDKSMDADWRFMEAASSGNLERFLLSNLRNKL
ncbi:hypothetical protein ACFSQD_00710 [Flavihumibacter stibioxidans]|uniref:DUF4468 domain-containing protein n=1 Tax=Flavihumibacter stibioxidans TaxID=1834163 RepID=A0ABR7MDK5_9BACT|nr:hypothetical protein [Flavihumibacter stibioxidans]MBC6493022.1 hypothetical protein [Flavihumibacter stibioxidans]